MPKKFFNTSSTSSSTLSITAPTPPTSSIPSTFLDGLPLPSLIVFDLDYTLWPFWVDTHVSGPVKAASKEAFSNTHMVDRWGESFTFYPGVPSILHAARQRNITLSLASRTHAPDLARDLLRGLYITPNTQVTSPTPDEQQEDESSYSSSTLSKTTSKDQVKDAKPLRAIDYFSHAQIYPGSKTTHFRRIQDATRKQGHEIAFADMLFFDDESRNRNVETELGATFHLVPDGASKDEVDRGVWAWRRRSRGITNTQNEAAELEG